MDEEEHDQQVIEILKRLPNKTDPDHLMALLCCILDHYDLHPVEVATLLGGTSAVYTEEWMSKQSGVTVH